MSVQYTWGYHEYNGGYHEYTGTVQHTGGYHDKYGGSLIGETMEFVWKPQCIEHLSVYS